MESRLVFNSKEIATDGMELLRSREVIGYFFIFTCSSGLPGCAGIYEGVKVEISPETVSWEIYEPEQMRVFTSQLFLKREKIYLVICFLIAAALMRS
jgi:hypothetical protein